LLDFTGENKNKENGVVEVVMLSSYEPGVSWSRKTPNSGQNESLLGWALSQYIGLLGC
jgi:hypothetical protein